MTTETWTITDMELLARHSELGDLPKVTIGTVELSPGLTSLLHQAEEVNCGIFWLLSAIAEWVGSNPKRSDEDGFDESGRDRNRYADLLEQDPTMELKQSFYLWRRDVCGAVLKTMITRGMVSHGEECHLTSVFYPIQKWEAVGFPWDEESPFVVLAMRYPTGWVLSLSDGK